MNIACEYETYDTKFTLRKKIKSFYNISMPKKTNTPFDCLIEEATKIPSSYFHLSKSFLKSLENSIDPVVFKADIQDNQVFRLNYNSNLAAVMKNESTKGSKLCHQSENNIAFKNDLKTVIKPIEKVFIDNNIYKYDNGVIKISNYGNDMFQDDYDFNVKLGFDLNEYKQFDSQSDYLGSYENDNMNKTFNAGLNLFQCNIKTECGSFQKNSVLSLVEVDKINIWIKNKESGEWKSFLFKLSSGQKVFRKKNVQDKDYIWIIVLISEFNLISIKYFYINVKNQEIKFEHGETFEVSILDLSLIHMCIVGPMQVALSIPRNEENIVDILLYSKLSLNESFSSNKKILYCLNNHQNRLSNKGNCMMEICENQESFIAIFNGNLFFWDLKNFNNIPKLFAINKFFNPEITCFDNIFDKGLLYIFLGNVYKSDISLIAISIDNQEIANVFNKSVYLDKSDSEDLDSIESMPNESVKFFKRRGDHLVIVKNNGTIILYNLISNVVSFQKQIHNLIDADIEVVNKNCSIIAVLDNYKIVDLCN